jgi:hypothetical protein
MSGDWPRRFDIYGIAKVFVLVVVPPALVTVILP